MKEVYICEFMMCVLNHLSVKKCGTFMLLHMKQNLV
jgi:hypothetical protein